MDTCARCGKEFADTPDPDPDNPVVADPCCGAPDCENNRDRSHFRCLPPGLQEIELEFEQDALDDVYETYDDYPDDAEED